MFQSTPGGVPPGDVRQGDDLMVKRVQFQSTPGGVPPGDIVPTASLKSLFRMFQSTPGGVPPGDAHQERSARLYHVSIYTRRCPTG